MNKLSIFLFLGVVFSLAAAFPANAKDCGGLIKCDCGDVLTQSHTMDYDIINCSSTALNIQSDNLNLNCNGHTINSPGSTSTSGIYIGFRNRVNVSNCKINGFFRGIYVYFSTNITLKSINLSDNSFSLYLYYSSWNRVENITSSNNYNGFYIINSNNNLIKNNLVSNNQDDGIYLYYSSNNDIVQNTISNNLYLGIEYSTSSYDNKIEYNNIIGNGYYNFANYNSYNVSAENNWWGSVSPFFIDLGIYDFKEYNTLGRVDFEPFLYGSYYKNQVPVVSDIKCYDGAWKDCNTFGYNSTLQKMRVNCTDRDGYITKARIELKDISNYKILASGNATLEAGYYVYDNPNIILDYNGLVLTALCSDNNSNNNTLAVDWLLRDGLPRSILFYEGFNYEESILKNNGTVHGIPRLADTKCGKSADLTSSAYLSYPLKGNFPNQTNLTIEFWFKNSVLSSQGFFDIGVLSGLNPNSMGIFYSTMFSVNRVITETRNNVTYMVQAHAPGTIIGSKWNHVALTFSNYNRADNTFSMTTYFNAQPGTPVTVINFFPNMSDDFWIGNTGYYCLSYAYMDEFRIYNYIRSPQEIYNDYLSMVNCTKEIAQKKDCVMFKPQSTGKVKINCSGLYVDNKPFKANGIGYQPIPIGETADKPGGANIIFNSPEIYNRDFPLLRDMNANSIRTWANVTNSSFLDAAWNNGSNPLYVVMGFWISCTANFADPATRQKIIDEFKTYVNKYKNHPAVLVWTLGNEVNLCGIADYVDDYYSLCNELAEAAYIIEGANYHPVGIVNWDLFHIGQDIYNSDDDSTPYLDFWGSNVYPGLNFNSWVEDYKSLSGKPLLITEYGIDALNQTNHQEYEDTHAEWVFKQWHDINASNVTIGSTLMAYSDEWWKGSLFSSGTNCPDYYPNNHSDCGYPTPKHPDGFSNEEWWGLMRTVKNTSGGPDIMQPRKLYYVFQQAWGGQTRFDLPLRKGWNLISIPLSVGSANASSLFPSGKLYGYNGSWFISNKIDPKKGYWVKANNSVVIPIIGVEIADKSINLNNGWNLIGHPYLQEKNVLGLFDNATLYSYNGSWSSYIPNRTFNPLQTLKPGYGYWVKPE